MSAQAGGQPFDLSQPAGETSVPSTPQDARALRRHVRDLAALLALPAMWSGREPAYIADNLIDVLMGLLRLDCACIRLNNPAGGVVEAWQPPTSTLPPVLNEALQASSAASDAEAITMITLSRDSTPLRTATVHIDMLGERGAVLAGSSRPDFPTDLERYLLQVATDQVANAVHGARLLVEVQDALARERLRTAQLRALTEAAVAVNSPLSLTETLQLITDQAREIVGAHLALTRLTINDKWEHSITTVSLSEKYAAWRSYAEPIDGSGIYTLVSRYNRPMRLTQAELEAHPAWHGFGRHAATHPPMRGWLAVPLIRRDGKNLGIVQLSDKFDDQEFTAEDETILIQLAQHASIAIENAQLIERSEQAVHARDDLLASVSHDLKNPLAGIKARAQLLRRRIAPMPDETKNALDHGLQEIDESSDRMTAIIDELIDAARSHIDHQMSLELRSLNLVDLTRDEVEYAQKSTGDHQIILIAEQPQVAGRWDPTRLSRAIANLLSNAIKYSPRGGEITVTVATTSDGPASGNWATITVADHGVGIPAEDLPHIFERFHRAANSAGRFPGTGIGLAGARRAIEEHGGRMTVESVEGEGSVFTAWLPLADDTLANNTTRDRDRNRNRLTDQQPFCRLSVNN